MAIVVFAVYVLILCATLLWTINRGKNGALSRETQKEQGHLPTIPRRSRLILMSSFFCLPLLLLFCTLVGLPQSNAPWLIALAITFSYFVQMARVAKYYFDLAASSPSRSIDSSKASSSSSTDANSL